MVRLDSGTDQWVTARELVLDAMPERANLSEGLEVIAAWPGEEHWYKGTIVHITERGSYRVQYDDWDEQTVSLAQIRRLPETFSGKRRKEQEQRQKLHKSSSASKSPSANAAPAASAPATSPANSGESEGGEPSVLKSKIGSGVDVSPIDGPADGRSTTPVFASMQDFVLLAREELLASSPDTFERLSQLLAEFDTAHAAQLGDVDDNTSSLGPELQALLAPHPRLLSQLERLLASVPTRSADAEYSTEVVTSAMTAGTAQPASSDIPADDSGRVKLATSEGDVVDTEAAMADERQARPCAVSHIELDRREGQAEIGNESTMNYEPFSGSGGGRDERAIEETKRDKTKGVRELQKLLDEFGEGAAVGVDGGELRRRRGLHEA